MKNLSVHYSSQSNEWETPQYLFDALDEEFNFTLDPCATDENHKCAKYYTKEQDGLNQSWEGERVFCNPPYGNLIGLWMEKAYTESRNALVVMLIPARPETKWWHNYCKHADEIRFIKSRVKFKGSKARSQGAPFPSAIVIFRNKHGLETHTVKTA